MIKVKNLNGTSGKTCYCYSWLDHWKEFSKQSVTYCCELTCTNKDLVGAHVIRADNNDYSHYIIPLCKSHNQSTDVIELSGNYKLVSANVKETCGK